MIRLAKESDILGIMSCINDAKAFLKAFEGKLKGAKLESFKGYEFHNIKTPNFGAGMYSGGDKETIYKTLLKGSDVGEGSFAERLTKYFYGTKEKSELKNVNIDEQISILKGTSELKKLANASYNDAAGKVKGFIKNIKKSDDKDSNGDRLTYYKAYSSAITQMHGTYLSVLGKRHNQAMAMCNRALVGAMKKSKAEGKKEEPAEVKQLAAAQNEGFVNTEAFLGAIEFI